MTCILISCCESVVIDCSELQQSYLLMSSRCQRVVFSCLLITTVIFSVILSMGSMLSLTSVLLDAHLSPLSSILSNSCFYRPQFIRRITPSTVFAGIVGFHGSLVLPSVWASLNQPWRRMVLKTIATSKLLDPLGVP